MARCLGSEIVFAVLTASSNPFCHSARFAASIVGSALNSSRHFFTLATAASRNRARIRIFSASVIRVGSTVRFFLAGFFLGCRAMRPGDDCWSVWASSWASRRSPASVPGAYSPPAKKTSLPCVKARAFTASDRRADSPSVWIRTPENERPKPASMRPRTLGSRDRPPPLDLTRSRKATGGSGTAGERLWSARS